MKPNTLFRWFFSKLSFVTVVVVVGLSWWVSSIEYHKEFSILKTDLLTLVLEVDKGKPLSDISSKNINYSIVNKNGTIVVDKKFGSMASIADSEYFLKAVSGDIIIRIANFESAQKMECWSLINYQGKDHVLILRKAFNHSKAVYFFINFTIIFILAIIILVFYSLVITNPVSDAITYLTSEIKNLQKEKYEKKLPSIDTEEFTALYDAYNKLSNHVQQELTSLRTDVNQWEVFFSTMPRGLIAIDDDRLIHNCNDNALDLMDVKEQKKSEVLGNSIMAVFRNADLNRITSEFFNSNKFLEEYEFELVANNIIETIKVICVELEINESEEKTKGAIVIIENITSLRRLENMRKDFVSNVSHELKTPISIIAGFIETLKECLDDPDSVLRFLDIIEKNTARLNLIINDLLNLSKLEQNEAVIRRDFENRNISETIGSALNICSHEAKAKDITIEKDLEDCKYYESETMLANHRLLEQAFRNLIENAIRYSPADSTIIIGSRKVKDMIEISIKDQGPGIPEEHQDKIFGRFYRVDKSRDRQTGGSGLGLAIVKHIARIHNGHVTVESKPGEGSTFTLVVPYVVEKNNVPSIAMR